MSTQTSAIGSQESSNSSRLPSPTFSATDLEEISFNHLKNNNDQFKESFNNSMNNSSGLGDSISLPCLSADCSSSSSSIYGGCNTVNANYSSCSAGGSMPDTPTSPNKYCMDNINSNKVNINVAPIFNSSQKLSQKSDATNQKLTVNSNKSISSESSTSLDYSTNKNLQYGNSMSQQMNSLNLNQVDYDPFNDYMGIDKITQMTGIEGQKNKANLNLDSQQQQQIIAQAIAAVASSSISNANSGLTSSDGHANPKTTTRSLTENIELLNSKFMNHKNQMNQNNFAFNSDKYPDSSINSLLATVTSHYSQNQANNNSTNGGDSYLGYNSPNLPMNLKRQSYPIANQNQQANNHLFGSASNNNAVNSTNNSSANNSSMQSGLNSRLNSTPNLYNSNSALSNEQNQSSNRLPVQSQHQEKQGSSSFSASNSSFNFNLNSSETDLSGLSSRSNQNNTSCYDDDDVFSNSNNSFNSPLNQTNNRENNNNNSNNANNADTVALAQIYRNLINSNNSNSTPNKNDTSNNTNPNLNELISSYNANLAALSLNPDLINSSTFLNSTNSMANQLKTLNNFQNTNSNTNYPGARPNNPTNLDQIAAAVLKQRQNMLHPNRSNSTNLNGSQSSNIAALTSATSNIASLLNLNNSNGSQNNNQHHQPNFQDLNLKRRLNSSTLANSNVGALLNNSNNNANTGSSGSGSGYNNSSSIFNTNVGPNTSQLLQNSSLASSARLNSATSSSAAASVLGNNSSLHALSSLQHQSGSNSNSSQNNNHNLFNSNSMNSNSNNNNNMQHQSNLINFNMSPSSSSNHGILSALSLSSTTGNSLQNQLLSASGKPLRSERLPSHIVEEIVKQAKIRRRNGGKKEVCVFCRNNGEKEQIYTSHTLKDASNHVACPILRLYQCPICHASGDQAHTIKYCPYAEKDSNCIKLFKENGRMSAAAAYLMNTLAGGNTSPSLSPPATPPSNHTPNHTPNQSVMQQNMTSSLDLHSPSNPNPLNAYLNFNIGKNNEIGSNFNKSFLNCSSILNNSSTATNSNTVVANTANSILTSRDSNSSLLTSNFNNSTK